MLPDFMTVFYIKKVVKNAPYFKSYFLQSVRHFWKHEESFTTVLKAGLRL